MQMRGWGSMQNYTKVTLIHGSDSNLVSYNFKWESVSS